MICLNCQSLNDAADSFCRSCGAALNSGAPPPSYTPNRLAATITDEKQTLTGRVIDERYRLESIVGDGGMGTVYRATRLNIGDTVAIKILHPERLADAQAGERFRREAQAAAALKHPNAVTIYDFGVTPDGLCYIVMELVAGTNLRHIIGAQGLLPVKTVAEIITQAAGALDEAHRQGIIHRDIKPDNIIVHQGPAGLQVKLLDFGIAKIDDAGNRSLTVTGSVMGTPHYMSPEQCVGEELDGRADIYSLGIVLYEMLTGSVPFKSPTSTAIVVQHVNHLPTPPRALNLSISPAVEAVVLRALAKRREDRPHSAGALAQELNAAVSAGVSPSSQMPFYGAGEAATATGSLHVSQPQPTVTLNTPFSGQQPATPLPAFGMPPPAKSKTLLYAFGVLLLAMIGVGAFLLWPKKSDGPWPDHLGLFARQAGALIELPRKDFASLLKARDELTNDGNLPVAGGQPTLILYAQTQDVPATDLKLFQLDSLEKDGKAKYWSFQIAPVSGRADMKQLKVANGLPNGKYAFALVNGFADEGAHKLWPFQVKEGVSPAEPAQTATLAVKPKTAGPALPPGARLPPSGAGPLPSGSVVSAPVAEIPLPPIGGVAYCRTNNVVLRAAPGLSGSKVDKLYSGQPLAVLDHSFNADAWRGKRSRWVLVRTADGMQGWVFGALVR